MIYVGYSSPRGFKLGAEVIKLWMDTKYSHTFILYQDKETKMWLVFHAAHGSVHLLNFEAFLKNNKIINLFERPADDYQYDKFKKYLYSNLAKKYGVLQIFAIVFRRILPKFVFPYLLMNGDEQFICSELVADVELDCFNGALLLNDYIDLTSPSDLMPYYVNNFKQVYIEDFYG